MRMQAQGTEEHFVERFKACRYLRVQMALILFGVCMSGPLFSKLLLLAGVHGMAVRYPVAVCAAYLVFFVLVKIWLALALPAGTRPPDRAFSHGPGDVPADLLDEASDLFGKGSSAPFRGGGGRFDGAGATVALGASGGNTGATARTVDSPGGSKQASGSSGSWNLDVDRELVVLFVFIALLAVIFGAAFLLVWQAPVILSEAALQAALASGLVRRTRQGAAGHWTGGVFRATWKPFAWVLAIALVLGFTAAALFPGAEKLSDILRSL